MTDSELYNMVKIARKSGESEEDIEEAVYTGVFRGVGLDSSLRNWSIMRAKEILGGNSANEN